MKLSPEQRKAMRVLKSNIHQWEKLLVTGLGEDVLIPTEYIAFSLTPFEHLPHGDLWTWNQSNAKVTIPIEDGGKITLVKMNTRRKKSYKHKVEVMQSNGAEIEKVPSYKIWLFCVQCRTYSEENLHFLWCEKGTNEANDTELPEIEDLAFLRSFTDEQTAFELGWT